MLVIAFYGQAGIDPILLAASVIPNVCVAESRQIPGGFLRKLSLRIRAVNDYLG